MLDRTSSPHTTRPPVSLKSCLRRLGLSKARLLLRHTSPSVTFLLLVGLTGCTTQGVYQPAHLEVPKAWSMPAPESAIATPADQDWWQQLNDPAIDTLVDAALADSPYVAQAIARVDEARALADVTAAQRIPSMALSASSTRARSSDFAGSTTSASLSERSSIGLGFSWEIDLFGRVRNSIEARTLRIEARDSAAMATRLALTAQVGELVLASRACELSKAVLRSEIDSREKTLMLMQRRRNTGFVAPVEESRARSGLATARTALATRRGACARSINALVAISGQPRGIVQALTAAETPAASTADTVVAIPSAPAIQLALPATILAVHPMVVEAERETAAAWSDIAVARAERLPRLDLGAALSGQWIRAAGQSINETVWSLGPALGGPVFDGGQGAANVSAAQARYRAAEANLRQVVRSAAEDVENAMAAIESATQRRRTTLEALEATQQVLDAMQASWSAGAVSLLEVEDARRQFAAAQNEAIAAAYDSHRAWIALVRASGHATAATTGGALS
ncbi:efflux transporter outer membrane subunit [Stenotrophomonas sp.]|uniref:efflux transporter outer membrane subunit n=1 Tax=Stenotrophomonas sp. TaxID=69392 RepID=UPI0028A96720|nr:efflux transporter outer membrane subunit [Stenotrophomonas sp.]